MFTSFPTRRFAAVAATVVLGVGVSGCSGGDDEAQASDASGTSTVTVTETASNPDPNPNPNPDPAPQPCTLGTLHESTGLEMLDVMMYCDGAWMCAGQAATDHVRNFCWTGETWIEYVADGRSEPSGYPCYSWDRLITDGVPEALRDQLTVCT